MMRRGQDIPREAGNRQKGTALPATLMAASLLGLTALGFVQTTRYNASAARADLAALSRGHLADAGIARALVDLEARAGDQLIPHDGRAYHFAYGGATVRLRIQDEKGKLDLNLASLELIGRLIDEVSARSDASLDREAILEAIGAARAQAARDRERRRAFNAVDELAFAGVSEQAILALSPFLTTSSFSLQINPLYADEILLAALPGLGAEAALRIVEAREAGDSDRALVVARAAGGLITNQAGPFYTIEARAQMPGEQAAGARTARKHALALRREQANGARMEIVGARPVY